VDATELMPHAKARMGLFQLGEASGGNFTFNRHV